jgi:RNA polymerase sigma-70 factor (ECF subfamily)
MDSEKQSYSSDQEAQIRLAMTGNLEAFNELVLTHQDRAYTLAYALLGDPALAEDATQEGFIKAFQNIGSFRGSSFRAWLLKIVTNSAYDILRKIHRHPAEPLFPVDENDDEIESPGWLADPAASVQSIVEQKETSTHLYQMLDELPDVYRTAITLIDIHEFDYVEAARILNIPLGTLKSRLARARTQMVEKLKDSTNSKRDLAHQQVGLVA